VAGRVALEDDPQLRPLWVAVHDRLCRGDLTDRSVVTVRSDDPDVRRAVDRLLGRVSTAGRLNVRVDTLDAVLTRAGADARRLAVAACGPVVDRSAARAGAVAAKDKAWARILAHPAAVEPTLAAWLGELRRQGRLARAGGQAAFTAALDVLEVLPRTGEPVGRAVLAAAILGNEHALDDKTDTERLVTAGLAVQAGVERPTTAAGRAALWRTAGVTFDAVSAAVLTLGLRPLPNGPLTEAAARWADGGVPLPIPATALTTESWRLRAGQVVFVCENPSVLEAAAAKLGPASPPLVCVSGMPSRAATALLSALAGGGADLRYHGDFGTGGVVIANLIISRHGAKPWRMSTADHGNAARRLATAGRTPTPLRGRVPQASWDSELQVAISRYGFEITEEHVLSDLLVDLVQAGRSRADP
jgi:uncharacterized protein (TIGR02679 family)